MRVAYDNAADLAKNIADAWRVKGRIAHPLPYSRWQWDDSQTWWVVPAPDKKAHQYGKIVATASPMLADSAHLFAGLTVEKGVGQALADIGVYHDDWVMKASWRWHGLVRDLANGSFREALAEASKRTGEAVEIRVAAHVPIRQGSVKPQHDIVAFETVDGLALSPNGQPQLHTSEGFLASASQAETLPQLGQALLTIPEAESAWVNVYIGRTLERSGLHDASAVDGHQLVDRLLDPLASWVV